MNPLTIEYGVEVIKELARLQRERRRYRVALLESRIVLSRLNSYAHLNKSNMTAATTQIARIDKCLNKRKIDPVKRLGVDFKIVNGTPMQIRKPKKERS